MCLDGTRRFLKGVITQEPARLTTSGKNNGKKMKGMENGVGGNKDVDGDSKNGKKSIKMIKDRSKPSFSFGIKRLDDSQEDSKSPEMQT
jgi:hypothetical protein